MPLPSAAWLGFRMETAYGARDRRPSGADVIGYLTFVREQRLLRRSADHHGPRRSAR